MYQMGVGGLGSAMRDTGILSGHSLGFRDEARSRKGWWE